MVDAIERVRLKYLKKNVTYTKCFRHRLSASLLREMYP